ncbi:MAG: glycosyltransferase [Pseudomonadota bacterium]
MQDNNSITVVIATLGGKALMSTLSTLNSGSFVPREILVCIPEREADHADFAAAENVSIVATPCRGQVAQRAFGFRQARHEYVLQLDDDMSVEHYCLERLVEASQALGSNVAVSPALIDEHTGRSVYERPRGPKLLLDIYFWLMNGVNGYQPGTIDRAGSAVGVDPATAKSRFVEVEWLAGGCILHRRENLVREDFWARPGKAYCEDVVHSHLLRQRGIRLVVDTTARCELEVARQSAMTFRAVLSDFYHDLCARRYYMKRVSRTSARMYLYYLVRFASHLWGRLRWKRSEP